MSAHVIGLAHHSSTIDAARKGDMQLVACSGPTRNDLVMIQRVPRENTLMRPPKITVRFSAILASAMLRFC